jgi:dipeptidyl aminopeptidase/acylaminoacyl peptidase
MHGREPLLHCDPKALSSETVIAPPAGINAFAIAPDALIYARIAAENPNELYIASHTNANPRRLTDLNTGWLAGKIISLPEEHWITRPDGTRVQYIG